MAGRVAYLYGAFPAHAGMNRLLLAFGAGVGGVPRTRGDEPALLTTRPFGIERSPHTRG